MAATQAIALGANYVAGKFFQLTDVLDITTVAMALERSGHPMKDDAYYHMKTFARHGMTIVHSNHIDVQRKSYNIIE